MICEERGAKLKYLPVREDSTIDLDKAKDAFSFRTKFLALVHISNSLGIVNPVKELISLARARGIPSLIDGAQAVAHLPTDLKTIGADFYTFSAHKLFGPTGLGVLAAPYTLLAEMNPLIGGGDMIKTVHYDSVTFADPPARFEAGTPPIAQVWGLGAAIDWIESISWQEIHNAERNLTEKMFLRLSEMKGLKLATSARENRLPVFSFSVEGAHAHDLGTLLGNDQIAVRSGHHCTQPLMRFLQMEATTRASLAFYNTESEIDRFVASLEKARGLLA